MKFVDGSVLVEMLGCYDDIKDMLEILVRKFRRIDEVERQRR